ncbi:MAG TPA: hypothetical protein VNH40_10095, partial [Gaiellaceae bacterium]|nr:hypothetical protein [Gaiellaceae bacterium]
KRKTRRGSRGGRKRRKPATASGNGAEAGAESSAEGPEQEAAPVEEPVSSNGDSGDWEYVPMSEWLDEIDSGR